MVSTPRWRATWQRESGAVDRGRQLVAAGVEDEGHERARQLAKPPSRLPRPRLPELEGARGVAAQGFASAHATPIVYPELPVINGFWRPSENADSSHNARARTGGTPLGHSVWGPFETHQR